MRLRGLKAELHLLTALADLGGVWSLDQVTGALSDATGSNRLGLWVVGICMVSAAVVAWTLRRTHGAEPPS